MGCNEYAAEITNPSTKNIEDDDGWNQTSANSIDDDTRGDMPRLKPFYYTDDLFISIHFVVCTPIGLPVYILIRRVTSTREAANTLSSSVGSFSVFGFFGAHWYCSFLICCWCWKLAVNHELRVPCGRYSDLNHHDVQTLKLNFRQR